MSAALLTTVGLAVLGLMATAALGLQASSGPDIWRHISIGFFSTLVTLLAHSMTMFYLIGKGKAVKEAMSARDGKDPISRGLVDRLAVARKPVFSIGMLAMATVMIAALMGAGVDTGFLPPMVHAAVAYGAIVCNLAALRVEIAALAESSRVVDEVDRQVVDDDP
jgi:hypothetical protein